MFTSGNKFQDSNCTWLLDSMNNEDALAISSKFGPQKMNGNEWLTNSSKCKKVHTHHKVFYSRMLSISALSPEMQNMISFTSLKIVKDAQCLGPFGAPPLAPDPVTQPSITPQLRLARGQLSSRGTRQLTNIIIHMSSINAMMVGINDESLDG